MSKDNLTEEKIVIAWSDALIADANYKGEISRTSFRLGEMAERLKSPEEIDAINKSRANKISGIIKRKHHNAPNKFNATKDEVNAYFDKVKEHLLHEGYIVEPKSTEQVWHLTERGKLAKELGGHEEFIKHRKHELNILRNQHNINWLLFSAAAASAIVPLVIAIFFSTKNIINVPPSSNQLHFHSDTALIRRFVEDALKERESSPGKAEPTR